MRGFSVAGTTLALIVAGAPNAMGADETVITAALIDEVAPFQGEIVGGTESRDGVATESAGIAVDIPRDPAEPLVLQRAEDQAPFTIDLPAELALGDGRLAADGTVVYLGEGDGASAAVQVLDSGATRLQTITPSADSPHEFTYKFGQGTVPIQLADGTMAIGDRREGTEIIIGTIDAPWAVDAAGNPVETSYRIDGTSLVQTIAPGPRTEYPVVADPSISLGWKIYVKFNKTETTRLGYSTIVPKAKYLAVLCAAAGTFVGTACGLYTYDMLDSVARTANIAYRNNKCLQLGYNYSPLLLVSWNSVEC